MSSEDATKETKDSAVEVASTGAAKEANSGASSSTRELYDEAKRELALKHYAVAADKLAHVLEELQENENVESDAPILAPILHRYGKAVLSLAISNSGALGGGGTNPEGGAEVLPPGLKAAGSSAAAEAGSKPPANDPRFSFGGDGEDDDEQEEDEGAAQPAAEGEDEDDFENAFSVLDLARVIYEKILSPAEGDESSIKLKTYDEEELDALQIKAQLAEVYNDLGDVGLETENFSQASSDYEQSLKVLTPLLRSHSRRLADAQLRLGLALEFHPETSERPRATEFVAAAQKTLKTRLDVLSQRQKALQSGAAAAEKANTAIESTEKEPSSGKGKGKATENDEQTQLERDDIAKMDESQVAKERKDLEEMIEELELKLQEYEQQGAAGGADAAGGAAAAIGVAGGVDRAALEKAISDAFLGASTNTAVFPGASASASDKPVNDLSAMVKKKKPVAPAETNGKRKAGEDEAPNGTANGTSAAEESDAKRVKTDA